MGGWMEPPRMLSRRFEAERRRQRTEAALKYAAHVEAFEVRRLRDGVCIPEGTVHHARMLPYWEAAAAQGDMLDRRLATVRGLAGEAAKWKKRGGAVLGAGRGVGSVAREA